MNTHTPNEGRWLIVNQRGSVLLIVYFVVIVLLGIGAAFAVLAGSESKTAERQRLTAVAFHLAEAGIERALSDLRRDFIADGTMNSWINGDIHDFEIGPDTENYYDIPYTGTTLNGGSYAVQLKNVTGSPGDIWIKSRGVAGGVAQTIDVYARMFSVSPWNYAIFAGRGASGAMVNGNVDIRGSVLILGSGLNPGDLAIDLRGTAEFVGNNYRTLAAALRAKVPALPTVVIGGQTVETLNAKLHVKRGIIGLSGSSSVGEANVAGNAYKETADGVFINDGFGGNQGAANVFSDNGTTNAYDMGEAVRFPSLSDPYMGYSTYQEYLRNNALILTNELNNVTAASSFSYSNANGSISMDGAGNLTVSGIVYVDGGNSVNLVDKRKTINYTGKGSILSTGNVRVDVNLLTAGNNSFPFNNIGFMTPNNITLGTTAQMDVMGLFYAENQIVCSKQTDVLGTFVSNYFNMGTNVPAIYQVPEVINHLPPGMIGGNAYWYMVVGWIKS